MFILNNPRLCNGAGDNEGIMELEKIRELPICYTDKDGKKCHESTLRSFHILEYVREMLAEDVHQKSNHQMLLDVISLLQDFPTDYNPVDESVF